MVKIIWTDQAIDDLNSIGAYIAQDSSRYASITIKNYLIEPVSSKNILNQEG